MTDMVIFGIITIITDMRPKCIFLDRDGVINRERGEYTFKPEDFEIIDGVRQALIKIKENGYKTIIITNQSGISLGIYTRKDMEFCHQIMMKELPGLIDDIYFSPYHPTISASLSRKPGSLMFEKAMAKHDIDSAGSWMLGDRDRDLIPARKLGMKTILINNLDHSEYADDYASNLLDAVVNIILPRIEDRKH